jgi:putative ABC transport system permease protein
MKTEMIGIALRNVLKNKRRSILNMLTFAVSVFVILLGFGMIKGQFDSIYERMIDLRTGHIKIYNKDYPAVKSTMPLDRVINDPDKVLAAIAGTPHMVAASQRIIHPGIISNSKKKVGIVINGIDQEKEKKILTAYDNVKGSLLPKDGACILCGSALANMLGFKPGSGLLLFSQTSGNMNNLVDASVSGVYTIGFDAMEKAEVYVPIAFARQFLDMDNKATEIIIRLEKSDYVPEAKKYIQEVLAKDFPGLVAVDWKEENADLFELAKAKMGSFKAMAMVFLFLSFFIIVNTMTMSVYERTAEIGTLRAIGFDKGYIMRMFIFEGFFLSLFGVILGWILAAPIIYYLNVHGLVLAVMKTASSTTLPMTDVLKAINTPSDWLISGFICMISGVLGAYFPAKMAADTNIVNALKRGVR